MNKFVFFTVKSVVGERRGFFRRRTRNLDAIVREGDLLVSCSAVTLKAGKEGAYAKQGHGGRPFDNFQKGVFVSANQTFDIAMYVYLAHQLTSAAQGNDTQVTHNHEHTTHETKQGGDRIQ